MVAPDVFRIVLDDPNRVYQPGQCVSGHVDLVLSKEMKTTGVFLTVYGAAKTHLTKNKSAGRIEYTVHYRSCEVYIDITDQLWGSDNGNSQVMPAGCYTLPFSTFLPTHCLSSFQGSDKGSVQFYCKVKIDRPWRPDHSIIEYFTVLSAFDLNLDPLLGLKMAAEFSKSLNFFCCSSGTAFFQITIPKSGYVPGEIITATLHISNQSNRRMKKVLICLWQNITYKAEKGGCEEKENRDELDSEDDYPRQEYSKLQRVKRERRKYCVIVEHLQDKQAPSNYLITKDIRVPPVVATMSNEDSIIQVHYELECQLVPSYSINCCKLRLPIIIGTVPFRLRPSGPLVLLSAPPLDPAPPPMYLEEGLSLMYPEQGPSWDNSPQLSVATESDRDELLRSLSYEKCIFCTLDPEMDDEFANAFAPRYPVYGFLSASSNQ